MNFCYSLLKLFASLRWLFTLLLAGATSFTFAPIHPALAVCDSDAVITRISVASDGTQRNEDSTYLDVSGDGRFVAYWSQFTNLVNPSAGYILVYDRESCQTTNVSVELNGTPALGDYFVSITTDGRFVVFSSENNNLVSGDTGGGDVFVRDLQTSQTSLVSVSSSGEKGNSFSWLPFMSSDGNYVVFTSLATNLTTNCTNDKAHIYVRDRQANQTTCVSVDSSGIQGNGDSNRGSISADGRYVVFYSAASNLVTGDIDDGPAYTNDVFVHDRQTGQTTSISVDNFNQQVGDHDGIELEISADGRYVVFESSSSHLVLDDTNNTYDVFVRDLQTGQTTRVSVDSNGTQGNGFSSGASISADGRYISFNSSAGNLVSDDTNTCGQFFLTPGTCPDFFVHDRITGETVRASLSANGTQTSQQTNYQIFSQAISGDGSYMAFSTNVSDLVPGDTNDKKDIFLVRLLVPPPPTTLVVNSANDVDNGVCNTVHCSLREAINAANELPDTNTITFAISSGGLQTIQPAFSLPVITSPVIIDGTSQPGFAGTPLIELDGSVAGSDGVGLVFAGGDSTVRGLVINRFKLNGIVVKNNGGSTIVGNFIGTDASGTLPRPNGEYVPVPNPIVSNGIYVDATAPNNIIGGTIVSERNVISGNNFQAGIMLMSSGNIVRGNFIGTDAAGTAALGNAFGVAIVHTNNNTIGGTEDGAGNIISGNQLAGMEIEGSSNIIQGNYIGTDITGTITLGNTLVGISIAGGDASNNLIGGTVPGAGNIIAFNATTGPGIGIDGTTATIGNAVLGNSIISNGSLGIDIFPLGLNPNDLGDVDTGPDGLQNFPVLSSGGSFGTGTTVNGMLNSQPNKTYRLEFFANAACDPTGYGEGQTYLGFTNVTTNGSGDVNFTANLAAVTSIGQFITATATDPSNNTSEFSACVPVVVISPLAASPNRNYFTTPSVPLSWKGVSWALGYELEVDTDDDFADPYAYSDRSLAASAQSDTATLPHEDRVYYWRVGAKKPDGSIVWSAVQAFTVDVP